MHSTSCAATVASWRYKTTWYSMQHYHTHYRCNMNILKAHMLDPDWPRLHGSCYSTQSFFYKMPAGATTAELNDRNAPPPLQPVTLLGGGMLPPPNHRGIKMLQRHGFLKIHTLTSKSFCFCFSEVCFHCCNMSNNITTPLPPKKKF